MNVWLRLFLLAALCLSGCTGQAVTPRNPQTAILSAGQTPVPSATATAAVTVTPTATATTTATVTSTTVPSPTATPTRTPFVETYPLKQVWIEYGATLGGPADNGSPLPLSMPVWVLYTDGTLIVYRDGAFQTRTMAKNETCDLLYLISRLGFYEIETDGGDYRSSPIYAGLPPDQPVVDAVYEYLIVNWQTPKTLWVHDAIKDYAIAPVKNILNLCRGYTPYGAQPYIPDRLALSVQPGRAAAEMEMVEAARWPAGARSLADAEESSLLYLDNPAAARVYPLLQAPYTPQVFVDEGQEYTVTARPLLPHERRTANGIQTELAAVIEPPFTCP